MNLIQNFTSPAPWGSSESRLKTEQIEALHAASAARYWGERNSSSDEEDDDNDEEEAGGSFGDDDEFGFGRAEVLSKAEQSVLIDQLRNLLSVSDKKTSTTTTAFSSLKEEQQEGGGETTGFVQPNRYDVPRWEEKDEHQPQHSFGFGGFVNDSDGTDKASAWDPQVAFNEDNYADVNAVPPSFTSMAPLQFNFATPSTAAYSSVGASIDENDDSSPYSFPTTTSVGGKPPRGKALAKHVKVKAAAKPAKVKAAAKPAKASKGSDEDDDDDDDDDNDLRVRRPQPKTFDQKLSSVYDQLDYSRKHESEIERETCFIPFLAEAKSQELGTTNVVLMASAAASIVDMLNSFTDDVLHRVFFCHADRMDTPKISNYGALKATIKSKIPGGLSLAVVSKMDEVLEDYLLKDMYAERVRAFLAHNADFSMTKRLESGLGGAIACICSTLLRAAHDVADQMGDAFISAQHIRLAVRTDSELDPLFAKGLICRGGDFANGSL